MKNLWTIAAVLLTALAACSKDDGIHTWEGKVLEYGTMKPVPGAAVYLIEAKGSILGPTIKSVVDSTLSDINGYFKFTFEFNPYISEISGKAHNYFDGSDVIGSTKNTNKDLILDPYAWLKVNVKNIDPVSDDDAITLRSDNCNNKLFKGQHVDDFYICTYPGNRSGELRYTVTKIGKGVQVWHSIDFQVGSRDTTEIFIEY